MPYTYYGMCLGSLLGSTKQDWAWSIQEPNSAAGVGLLERLVKAGCLTIADLLLGVATTIDIGTSRSGDPNPDGSFGAWNNVADCLAAPDYPNLTHPIQI